MTRDRLFVYGTLRSACDSAAYRQLIAPACKLLGPASVSGALYDIGQYPGVLPVENGQQRVIGELFAFDPRSRLLDLLDDYEGCSPHYPEPREYYRQRVPVTLETPGNTKELPAWVYFYNWGVDAALLIPGGDYLQR